MNPPVRRALISTFDKRGVVDFARQLHGLGVVIVSSGGTAREIAAADIPVTSVADATGSPEMLGGRVKTLHPSIHGGILADRADPAHAADLETHGIAAIDLVAVNLYPFEQTVADPQADDARIIEMIDIGGPAMVRAAAKNHASVIVIVDPDDYAGIGAALQSGDGIDAASRRRLARKAFSHTAAYDAAIRRWMESRESDGEDETGLGPRFAPSFTKTQDLRYGENPHQRAAFYAEDGARGISLASSRQLQGKELSFNNILDLDAALGVVLDFPVGACAIIKHGNPCGAATAEESATAFRRALECDPVSAFGGVIAFNRDVDEAAAGAIAAAFYEAVIAPSFSEEALERLRKKKKLRLLATGGGDAATGLDLRRVRGGLLVQDADGPDTSIRECRVVTERRPSESEWDALQLGWTVCRHVKSNAIVYALEDRTIGIGAGQMSRVDSARFGIQKAQVPLTGAAMASDAFFPFRDGLDVGAEAGVKAVVQPGGSIRDDEVIAAANEHGIAMVFTSRRHFRH